MPLTNRLPPCFSFSVWLERILKYPVRVISGIFVITLFFFWQLFHLSFATSVYDLVVENIPETVQYNEFKKIFGSDEIIRIVVKGADIFASGTFEKVTRISEEASRIKGVRRIISLPEIKKGIDISGRLSLEDFSARIRPVALFQKNLISEDQKSTSLTLVLSGDADRHAVIEAVNRLLEKESQGLAAYQIGIPLVSEALSSLTKKDFCRLPPISMLLFAGILFVLYRHVNCIVVPLLCVAVAMTWTFGLMSICKISLSMLTMMVPIFLLAIGVAYCLHICSEYLAFSRTNRDPIEVVRSTFSSIAFPTFLTVFTTVIGFASLWVNRITAIREFAFFSSFGLVSILFVLFTLFPAVLSLLPPPRSSATFRVTHFFDRLIQQIIRLNLNRQYVTLPILAMVLVFCVAGIFRIEVETNPMGYLKPDSPVSRNFHDIYRDLSGSFPLNVVMESGDADYFENPSHIRQISDLQKMLATISGVDKTVSFADYLMLVNYVVNRFDPGYYAIPDEAIEVRMLVNNYKMLLGDDMLKRFMSPDFSKANLLLFTHIASSNGFLDARDQILKKADVMLPPAMNCSVTGLGMAIASSSRLLTHGQVKSLTLTMGIIFGLMLLMFMSVKVGGISILPNLLPVVVNFGLMGWLGIELSMVTSLIASIAIGLAVDDTIHYLVRYNRKFKDLLDKRRSLEQTLRHVGKPMIFTTLTICTGFSILAFSSFQPTAALGIMLVVIMIAALVGDILLLPSLMLHVELVTLWDLVRVKMGKDPQEAIPLFRGLRRGQVRALMASGALRNIGPGQILFNKGDPSDFMYTIVSGSFDVVDPDPCNGNLGLCKRIAQLGAGDVVGEMGFFRSVPRSATVVATDDGVLLLISWKILTRLQWLYPPIAHKFFHNLMNMMCDRLDLSTQCLSNLKCVDDLTGLCNRKEFERILEIEMDRSHHFGSVFSVCMIRLLFPAPEDRRQEKHRLSRIETAARQLTCRLRKCDTVCRYDVYTFSILMPQTDPESASRRCNRLREAICAEACEELPFTSACGVATLTGHSDGPSGLLSRAEAQLSLT